MEEGSARREAERGTFDPTYLVYTRRQTDAAEAAAGLQAAAGQVVLPANVSRYAAWQWDRAVLAAPPVDARRDRRCGDLLESEREDDMPLYEYLCDACGHRFEMIQKFSDPPLDTCPKCGGAGAQAAVAPAFQFKGSGWYITDYARNDQSAGWQDGRRREGRRSAEKSEKGEKPARSVTGATRKTGRPEKRKWPRNPKSRVGERERHDSPDNDRRSSTGSGPWSTPAVARALAFFRGYLRSERREIGRELLGEIRPPEREIHDCLEEPQLVAGVVPDALDFAGVNRPRLQQLAQAIGQLDFARPIALGCRQRRKDVGGQDVAADDGEVRRRFVRAAAFRRGRAPDTRRRRGDAFGAGAMTP